MPSDTEFVKATPATPDPDPLANPILRYAWIHFLQFDIAANDQKRWYVRIRALVLILAFATSVISVVFTSKTFIADGLLVWLGAGVTEFIRLILFLLPLISTGIMAYATQFIPSQSWAKYRYSAEMIRRAIFLYRTDSEPYYSKKPSEKKDMLSQALTDANNFSGLNITTDQLPFEDDETLTKKVGEVSADKNGFGPLNFDTYFEKRLDGQLGWYREKSFGDYHKMQRWQQYTLVVAAAGSLLTFLHFEAWVTVTTTAVFTITALANLMMYGRTYNIYLKAAQDIEIHRREWKNREQSYRDDLKNRADFIQKTEAIFGAEIDIWMNQTRDLLSENESGILKAAGSAAEANQSPTASPKDIPPPTTDETTPPQMPAGSDQKNDLAIPDGGAKEIASLNGIDANGSTKETEVPS